MVSPNLFIVGAAKSGTSSLWQYLGQNTKVYMPEDELYKEPAFFSHRAEHRGMDWYLNLFAAAGKEHTFVGEASTAYLTDPSSAKRIHDFNPEAKIIIMLRNPADRAYSLYNWMVQDGYEFAGSFEEALKLEEERAGKSIPNWYEPEYYWNYLYFRSGLYAEQVRRYLDYFGENVLVVKFEDFKNSTAMEYQRICDFLGIKANPVSKTIFNPSRKIISAKIQFTLRKITDALLKVTDRKNNREMKRYINEIYKECNTKLAAASGLSLRDRLRGYILLNKITHFILKEEFFREIKTKAQRDSIMSLGFTKGKPEPIRSNTRQALLKKYAIDIQKLSRLTGIDFGMWIA